MPSRARGSSVWSASPRGSSVVSSPGLERFFPGDDAWEAFARSFPDGEANEETQKRVEEVVGDRELAVVITGLVLHDPLGWLEQEVPALGGRSPRQCLADSEGRKRLKTLLMRMP